jgi:hypothetical protein
VGFFVSVVASDPVHVLVVVVYLYGVIMTTTPVSPGFAGSCVIVVGESMSLPRSVVVMGFGRLTITQPVIEEPSNRVVVEALLTSPYRVV